MQWETDPDASHKKDNQLALHLPNQPLNHHSKDLGNLNIQSSCQDGLIIAPLRLASVKKHPLQLGFPPTKAHFPEENVSIG